MKQLLIALLLTIASFANADTLLQGDINLVPDNGGHHQNIEPGTWITLSITVENLGKKPTPEGSVYIRFAYTNPLSSRTNSELFRTEEQTLPPLQPKEKATITFQKKHRWPTIFDFIKNNWGMRQYQAEATIDNVNHTIGTASIAFTMHYYPGPKHELPKEFPTEN